MTHPEKREELIKLYNQKKETRNQSFEDYLIFLISGYGLLIRFFTLLVLIGFFTLLVVWVHK